MGIWEIIAAICIIAGLVFLAIATAGLFRFPDFYTRLHSSGIGDTLGALLIIVGMMILCGLKLITIKVFMIFGIILLTNPMGTNLITMAGIHKHDYQNYNEKVRPKQTETEKEGE